MSTSTLISRTTSAYTYPLLIKNLFQAPVVDNPDQEIIYRNIWRYTYSEFRTRVCRLANMLTNLGVKPGDTVAVMDWDSHRYLECFYAIPMLGAVLHTVNIRLTPEQILYTIDHAEDDYLLVNEEFLPIIEQIKGRIDTVQKYILINGDTKQNHTDMECGLRFVGDYETLLQQASDHYTFTDFDENTRATTFYTTGTTGMPKGVYFSHRQLVLHTLSCLAALGTPETQGRLHQNDVYMPITPMFHVHAWGMPYIATALGVKQVYPGKYAPNMLLNLIETEGVTFSHCVPTILHLLIKSPHFETTDLSRWKVLIGGSALPKAMCRLALEKGIDIYTGYGMSETCPILTISHVTKQDLTQEEEIAIRCKTGRAIPLAQLRVVDENMTDIARDGISVGEVVVRTPWLTQGYLKDSRNSEQLWLGGYLHTGDVAKIDANNYVSITDRTKDVIKVGGEWVSSLEIEDVISSHPAVEEVAVLCTPDEKWGERPLALIVFKEGKTPTDLKVITSYVKSFTDKGLLTKLALLLKMQAVSSITKTSVGKVNKRLLREEFSS